MNRFPGPAIATPQDRIPITRWGAQEEMVKELKGERWFSSGLWIPNTVQPTWEIGRRWGEPRTIIGNLDINGQNAFLPGPADNKRWFLCGVSRAGSTGASQVLVRPKDSTDTPIDITVLATAAQVLREAWPGIPIENDNDRFGGGDVGLRNSSNGADTGVQIVILVYETDM